MHVMDLNLLIASYLLSILSIMDSEVEKGQSPGPSQEDFQLALFMDKIESEKEDKKWMMNQKILI